MRDILIDLDEYVIDDLYKDNIIRQGENLACQFVITLNTEFTGYDYRLAFQLNNNQSYYSLEVFPVDGVITYIVTNVLTFEAGNLKVELQAYNTTDGFLEKTAVFNFKIRNAIEGEPLLIPEEYESYKDVANLIPVSVNNVEAVEQNISLTTDNIPETVTNRYVPETPLEPTNKFLNGNAEFINVEPPAGGYSNNLYFGTIASDVLTYKVLSYTPDVAETILEPEVTSSEGVKLVQNYLYPMEVESDLFPAGLWSFSFYGKVSSASGVTQLGVTYFRRSTLGVETDLFTAWSNEIDNTAYGYIQFQLTNPSFTISPTDRMGARIYVKTTRTSNVIISFKLGDGYGAYLNNPNRIRHSQLRGLTAVNSHPASAISILDTVDSFTSDNVEGALGEVGLKAKGKYDDLPPFPILATTLGSTAPTLATFKGNIKQYTFDATTDTVFGTTEITHQYKEDTNLFPHLHWATNGLEGQNKYVKWELEYSIGKVNGAFSNAVAINTGEVLIATNTPDRTHKLSEFSAINGAGLTIGTYICWILRRIVSVGDAPTSNPFALALGFHVEQDTFGSTEIGTK